MRRWIAALLIAPPVLVETFLVASPSASTTSGAADRPPAAAALQTASPPACELPPVTAAPIDLDPTLLVSGPAVTAYQTALAAAGLDPGPIDGVYGPRTAAGTASLAVQSASWGACQVSPVQTAVLDAGTSLAAAAADLAAQAVAARAAAASRVQTAPVQVSSAPVAAASDPGSNQAIGQGLAAGYGWSSGGQWDCLVDLWNHESGWRTEAHNGSGAHGIPQALPGSKMGPGWESDPVVQISWGLGYIAGRYGDPCGALDHWRSYNWY